MAWNALIDPLTKQFYPDLVPEGGGVPLAKGQLISALASGKEVAVPVGADGTILMADSNQLDGLSWAVVPGAINFTAKGQLISSNAGNDATIVPAPTTPAQDGWVLTATPGATTGLEWAPVAQAPFTGVGQMQYGGAAPLFPDTPLNIGTQGQILKVNLGATAPVWADVGGGGTITATAPLVEAAVGTASNIAINFAAGPAGQIPYGNGTALTGALTNTPAVGQILGVSAGLPAWIDAGGSGTITATAPLVESAVGAASNIAINFALKGDLPVGTGAGTGTIFSSGTNGYLLSAQSSAGAGLQWVAPTSAGGPTIIRNNNVSLDIAAPVSTNEQLLLVAGTISESWDTIPLPIKKPYIATATIKTANGNQYVAKQLVLKDGDTEYAVAELYQVFPVPAGTDPVAIFDYDLSIDSGIFSSVNGMYEIAPNQVVIYGNFQYGEISAQPKTKTDFQYGLIRFDATTNLLSTFNTTMGGVIYTPNDTNTSQAFITDVQVHNGKMFVCGRFNATNTPLGALGTTGYGCILQFPDILATTAPLSPTALSFNLGIVLDPGGTGTGDQVINCMYFQVDTPVDFIQAIMLGGKFTQCGLTGAIDPEVYNGYAYYDYITKGYEPLDAISPPLGPAGTVEINSWNISLSAGAGGVAGSLLLASGVMTNFVAYIEFGAGLVFPIVLAGITGASGLHSVNGGNIVPVVGDPAAVGDVVLFNQATTLEMLCYFIPAQAVLAPAPGVPVLLPAVNKIFAQVPDADNGTQNPFGIVLDPFTNPAPAVNSIYVSQSGVGDIADQILVYNAAVRNDITFIPVPPCKFVQGATEFSSATFIAASSQYFISNDDRTKWIVSGGLVAGLVLNP